MNHEPHLPTPTTLVSPRATQRWGAIAMLLALLLTTFCATAPVVRAADAPTAVACTIYWDGGAGTTYWMDAANWTDDRLPYWADDVCIYAQNAPTGVTLDGPSLQTINSLSSAVGLRVGMYADAGLRLVGPSYVGQLLLESGYVEADYTLTTASVTQTGGDLGGPGNITVNGDYHWSGGRMWGPGWTNVAADPSYHYGLYLHGGGDLEINQRLLQSQYGVRWQDDTALHITDNGALRSYGSSLVEAPGASIDGNGTFDNSGTLTVAAGATFRSDVRTTAPDGAWFDLSEGDTYMEVGPSSVIDGDVYVRAGTELGTRGAVELTANSQVQGQGLVSASADATSVLTNAGKIDVGSIDVSDGTMTVTGSILTDDISVDGGILQTEGSGYVETAALDQVDGELKGHGIVVTGDATFVDAAVVASNGASDTVRVDGTATVDGLLTVQNAVLQAGAFGFDVTADRGSNHEPGVELTGDRASLDVINALTAAVTAKIARGESTTASLHAGTLAVDGEAVLTVDVAFVVDADDTVTVGADASLVVDELTQRGTITVNGEMDLTGTADIEADIDVTSGAVFGVGANSWTTLIGGATIGGSEAEVDNEGLIDGTGGLIGDVFNMGDVAPDGSIDVVGVFEQDATGSIDIEVNGDHHGSLDVVGSATLGGTLAIGLEDGGSLPVDPYDAVTASASIDGTFAAVQGLQECADLTYSAHAVTVVPQPCVAIAAGRAEEGDEHLDFVVSLTEVATHPVIVHYGVVPGTADITDYVDSPGASITIPAGETQGTISIALIDDEDEEQDETFTVGISVEGAQLANAEATGTIIDDDTKLVMSYQGIPTIDGIQYIQGLGTEYVVGISSPDADTDIGWAYRISDDAFAQTKKNFQPDGINQNDQAIGRCDSDGQPCMRDHGVDTILAHPNNSMGPTDISDDGEIVGYQYTGHNLDAVAVRWATPTSGYEVFPALPGSTRDMPSAVTDDGTIVGTSTIGTETHGWIRTPDGQVTDVGTILGLPKVDIVGVAADGTVAGTATDGQVNSTTPSHAFTWTRQGGIVDLGPGTFVLDINSHGDMVGLVGPDATLWRDGKVINLNRALGFGPNSESGLTLWYGDKINDQGTIVVKGGYQGYETTGVLVPEGAGCKVCLDGHIYEPEFPRPDYLIDAGDEIVEGNPAELFAEVTNHDDVARTVSITFYGPDGQPMGEPRSLTIAPTQKANTFTAWDTNGLAWKNGADAGPVDLKMEMRSSDGQLMASVPFRIRVIPRPVVNVHGMNSDASTWAAYPAFVSNAHYGWKAFAVDTMDTKPWIPNSVAENAALLDQYVDKIQRQENAWQVDLVAHSMGGLISRYYIQNLMPEIDGHRAARSLVMLGTPNAGSPCADLFRVPMTAELRTDVMAEFNQNITDHRGVPFSLAAGDPLPMTCNKPGPGDMVVPLDSALTGVEDTAVFPILHTDMTFSAQLFTEFVMPRLDGQQSQSAVATTGFAPAVTSRASTLTAAATATAATEEQAQLLLSDRESIAAGATASFQFQVPTGIGTLGVTALGADSLEVTLEKAGDVVATTGTDPSFGKDFRTISTANPVNGTWTVRFTNHGSTSLDVPSVVWVQGSATKLEVHAAQVGILGKVVVTARVTGTPPSRASEYMTATATDHSGKEDLIGDLRDNGVAPDAVAGDGTYTGQMSGFVPGPVVIDVSTDNPEFYRVASTGLVVRVGSDGPGNDAPIAMPATVTVPTGATSRIDLEAADPEGKPVSFEIVTQPAHGQLGGFGPFYDYRPATDYQGADSFVYRVNDGEKWSAPATVSITVGKATTTLTYQAPVPRVVTKGLPMHVVMRVEGPRAEAVNGGTATFQFGTHTVEATVNSGRLEADVPVDVASGTHQLVVTFNGNAGYSSATFATTIEVWEGSAPAPKLDPTNGEAGYVVRLWGSANDPDVDAVRYQFDFTDDGVFDAEVGPNEGRLTGANYTYPAAFDGQARLRVTDAAGHVVDAVAPVHIAPHRELGALRRILVEGEPVKVIDVSDDGRLMMYQVTDNEGEFQMPTPYGVLDRETGAHEIVSIRTDGQREDFPFGGVLSPDGRTVAFSSEQYINGFLSPQVIVRNLDTGVSVRASLNNAGQMSDRGGVALDVTNGGTKVLFQSAGRNMTDFDTYMCGTSGATKESCDQLYVRDLTAATTTLVSERVGTTVAEVLYGAGMSADGRYVAYGSRQKVWFVDLQTGTRSELAAGDRYGIGYDFNVSDDGRYVTFSSEATNLVPGDTNGFGDVFRLDRQTGAMTIVSATPAGAPGSQSSQGVFADRCAGRSVFWSNAPDLVAGDTNEAADLFLHQGNSIRRINVEARDGTQSDSGTSLDIALSGNGRFVFFFAGADDLVPGDVEGLADSFVLDLGSTTSCDGTPPPPVNHAPTASAVGVTTDEDVAMPVTLAGADADGDELTFTIASAPSHGTLSGEGASRTYAPAANWSGTDTFTYTASDGKLESGPATVTITVAAVNDAPSATPASVSTDEDVPVTVTLAGADVEADALTFEVATGPAHGTVSGSGAARTYTPAAGWSGTDSFTYTASDGTATSAAATVTVTVNAVDHAPTAAPVAVSTSEDVPVAVTLAGTDSDGDTLTYQLVGSPAHGALSGEGAARTYTPAANWFGTDTFTYVVSAASVTSAVATATITVGPVNDAPVPAMTAPASLVEGATGDLTASATDVDGDALTYSWATDGGSVTPAASGVTASLAAGDGPATRHVTVTVNDGLTSVAASKDVVVTNAAPSVTITAPAGDVSVAVNTALAVSATTADPGGDTVTCTISWGDTGAASNECAGSHAWAKAGTYTVTVKGTDDDGASTSVTRVVTVTPATPAWTWTGFFAPVKNLPAVNTVEPGSTIPVKFSLGGDRGTAIFAAGYPASFTHQCGSTSTPGALEPTTSAGKLTYSAKTKQYTYTWKTAKAWSGQCRTLVVRLADGSEHTAEFRFKGTCPPPKRW